MDQTPNAAATPIAQKAQRIPDSRARSAGRRQRHRHPRGQKAAAEPHDPGQRVHRSESAYQRARGDAPVSTAQATNTQPGRADRRRGCRTRSRTPPLRDHRWRDVCRPPGDVVSAAILAHSSGGLLPPLLPEHLRRRIRLVEPETGRMYRCFTRRGSGVRVPDRPSTNSLPMGDLVGCTPCGRSRPPPSEGSARLAPRIGTRDRPGASIEAPGGRSRGERDRPLLPRDRGARASHGPDA